MQILIKGGTIVTAQEQEEGSILIEGDRIARIFHDQSEVDFFLFKNKDTEVIDASGRLVLAGGIDAHVHFREPGLEHKADMESESAAAVLGGVTSFVDMPNTVPQTTTREALEQKLALAEGRCAANYGFHIGATNSNYKAIKDIPKSEYCGIKVFMGSSTGNMLVNEQDSLQEIFNDKDKTILVHCEDEKTIKDNQEKAKKKFCTPEGEDRIPFSLHPQIRSRMACIKSSMKALEMAMKCGTSLHLCHISTKEEAEMVRAAKIHNPGITSETSPNYLWFNDEDYDIKGGRVKCNPSIKQESDRLALINALSEGVIDTIGTDHAPHLLSEKDNPYLSCPSGMPSIQYSLPVLLTVCALYDIPYTRAASAFAERPAEIFGIDGRGSLKEGGYADIVIASVADKPKQCDAGEGGAISGEKVSADRIVSKCGWSPYEGETLLAKVETVIVNGEYAVKGGELTGTKAGKSLKYR